MSTVTPIRPNPHHPYREPPLAWQSDALHRIAGHDLAIETALADISRTEGRIAELLADGVVDEVGADGKLTELAYARMYLRGFEHALAWNLQQTRSRRRDARMEPHPFDRVLQAAE